MKKNRKNKGFTLVELIVVLVILAILAAMLVPALTGYIDKANEKVVAAEARATLMASQTLLSDFYGRTTGVFATGVINATSKILTGKESPLPADPLDLATIGDLAELNLEDTTTYTVTINYDANGKITTLAYDNKKYATTYTAGSGWSAPVKH